VFTEDDGPAFAVLKAALFRVAKPICTAKLAVYTLGVQQTAVRRVDVGRGIIEIVAVNVTTGQSEESDQGLTDHQAHREC